MITFLSYFIVPTAVFLAAVKLNNKRRWLTSRVRGSDYWTQNGKSIDKILFWFFVVLFFVLWWIAIPLIAVALGVSWIIHWLTNGEGAVPVSKETNRNNDYYR